MLQVYNVRTVKNEVRLFVLRHWQWRHNTTDTIHRRARSSDHIAECHHICHWRWCTQFSCAARGQLIVSGNSSVYSVLLVEEPYYATRRSRLTWISHVPAITGYPSPQSTRFHNNGRLQILVQQDKAAAIIIAEWSPAGRRERTIWTTRNRLAHAGDLECSCCWIRIGIDGNHVDTEERGCLAKRASVHAAVHWSLPWFACIRR